MFWGGFRLFLVEKTSANWRFGGFADVLGRVDKISDTMRSHLANKKVLKSRCS